MIPIDVTETSSKKNTEQTTMSNVNSPMKADHILNPVSAHWISTVVLSRSVRNKKNKYTFSIIFASLVRLKQSEDGRIALKKILKTP